MAREPVYSFPLMHMHAGATQEYTVEAGYSVVVRCITAFNASEIEPEQVQLVAVGYDITIFAALMTYITSGPSQQSVIADLRYVALEGEQLRLTGDGDVDATVSGYLLSLP